MKIFFNTIFDMLKNALKTHRSNTVKVSLLTVLYLVLSIMSILWVVFFIMNYPLKSVMVGTMLGSFRIIMILINNETSILLVFIHILGIISIMLFLIISILYYRYLYLNIKNRDIEKTDNIFMPFSVFISALITDIFLMLVSIVGLVFFIVPSFILTVRYKFVRLSIISDEKTVSFSKLVSVPLAFARSAKIVSSKNTISTFLHLLAIFVIKHSAVLILLLLVYIVSIFIPGLLGGGVLSIILWTVIILWYIVCMPIGVYMYILYYIKLSDNINIETDNLYL